MSFLSIDYISDRSNQDYLNRLSDWQIRQIDLYTIACLNGGGNVTGLFHGNRWLSLLLGI